MNFDYSPNDISAGMINKSKAEETPNVFAEMDGASQVSPTAGLDETAGQRMAGPVGARAMRLMNDPAEQERVGRWMASFAMSNQGMEFNQARMMAMTPPQEEPQQ